MALKASKLTAGLCERFGGRSARLPLTNPARRLAETNFAGLGLRPEAARVGGVPLRVVEVHLRSDKLVGSNPAVSMSN
jgi:hypothetical protein